MSTSFPILDFVLGLFFIFFLLSIITSSAVELVLSFFKLRGRELSVWLYKVLDKPALNSEGFYYDQEGTAYTRDENGNYLPVSSASAGTSAAYQQKGARAYQLKLVAEPGNTTPATTTGSKSGAKPSKDIKLVSLGQSIMDHCTATVLSDKGSAPTYIDARNFISAFLEKVTINPAHPEMIPEDIEAFKQAIASSPLLNHELKRSVLMLANEAADEAKAAGTALMLFRVKLETWYDATTDRISGDLKRKWALPFTILIAVFLTIGLNADTVAISKFLYTNKEARTALANTAQTALDTANYNQRVAQINQQLRERLQTNPDDTTAKSGLDQVKEASDRFHNSIADLQAQMPQGLPLGPDKRNLETMGGYIRRHWLGWLCSILAISLGAPFWFDLLNKVANLRGTGPKPASTTDAERKVAGTDKK